MSYIPPRCVECGRQMMPTSTLLRAPHLKAEYIGHKGRGLCVNCYNKALFGGWLHDYPRLTMPYEEIMDGWVRLRGPGITQKQVAEQLGCTHAALRQALSRARHEGDPRRGPASPMGRPRRETEPNPQDPR